MTTALSLLGSFSPSDWNEELYSRLPPYVLENAGGKVFVLPMKNHAELVLDELAPRLGLKKRKQGHTYFVVDRGDSIRGFRQFDWFLRRSWKRKDFAVLWAVVYVAQMKGWNRPGISLESVAEIAGLEPKQCSKIFEELLEARVLESRINGFTEYEVDRKKAELILERFLSQLPSWPEEVIMNTLCSGIGGSIADIYENLFSTGLTIGAAYKIMEGLKEEGYVYPMRHFRVNEKGPMRELLSANCRNCFYGYTSEERCLLDTFRQLEDSIERYYGKKLSRDERNSLYLSIKSIPYSSRICRRVLESLRLIHQVERITKEGRVLSMLNKIEDKYGIQFPLKTLSESSLDSSS
jgi:hypothetical protein